MKNGHSHHIRFPHIVMVLLLVLAPACTLHAETLSLIYPQPVSAFDQRSEYPLKLLELALSKTTQDYSLKPSAMIMNKARVTEELAHAKEINVAWMVTSIERETKLLPVRICVFKGLGGWRISLIQAADLQKFSKINKLQDLKQFTAGQQPDWPDTDILRASGIPVETTTTYDSLFKMLINNRFQWFPRSIPEIWAEADTYKDKGIVIEPHILIRYPSAYYFFVNRKDTKIAKTIESGLEIALKDGSFDKLFFKYHGDVIARANIKNRVVIDLPNPYLPPLTPLKRKDLWFHAE